MAETTQSKATQTVMDEVATERRRQIDVEGWTPQHDDQEHGAGEQLARAAAAYAIPSYWRWNGHFVRRLMWPWDDQSLKPGKRRRELVKSAALIVAQIEQMDRDEQRMRAGQ